jgi:hypothetical protein
MEAAVSGVGPEVAEVEGQPDVAVPEDAEEEPAEEA